MGAIKWIAGILLLLTTLVASGSETLDVIEEWDHGERILGNIQEYTVDTDGWLVGGFEGKEGKLVITPEKALLYAPYGQGPSDLTDLRSIFSYHDDMAIVERCGKVKIFTKQDNTYVWKATKWFKTSKNMQNIQDGIFVNNKWFFAGKGEFYTGKKIGPQGKYNVFYVRVHDDEGKVLKELVREQIVKGYMYQLMRYFVDTANDQVIFMKENKLAIKIISTKKLEIKKEVDLEKPAFYKPMPADYYKFESRMKGRFDLLDRAYEKWKTTYGIITKIVNDSDCLVVQLRTCNEKMKKFALLFYDNKTFKLKKTIYTDDLLMTAQNGKYYFYAGGNPKLDEVDQFVIKVCRFKKD